MISDKDLFPEAEIWFIASERIPSLVKRKLSRYRIDEGRFLWESNYPLASGSCLVEDAFANELDARRELCSRLSSHLLLALDTVSDIHERIHNYKKLV